MGKHNDTKIGSVLYLEWLKPIFDYYSTLKFKYVIFEILLPLLIGIFCTIKYTELGKVDVALDALCELLPTIISILIGFTTMLITLLLTSSGGSIRRLKNIITEQELDGSPLSLYQSLHIQFLHSLFSEILFLLLVFMYLYLKGFEPSAWVFVVSLGVFVFYIVNILLSILRGIVNVYFSFYNKKNDDIDSQ